MKVPKVVHLSSVHTPFDTRIFRKECITLQRAGYDVGFVVPHHQDERVDGVRIIAVPKQTGRLKRMTRTVWNVYRAAVREDADIYHFHDPELIPIGMLLTLRKKRVIYDAHEDLPGQILSKYWIPRWVRGIVAKGAEVVETIGSLFFDGIVAVTPAIASRFPKKKTAIVQNFPLLNELAPSEAVAFQERRNAVAFVGGISVIRGVKEVIEALTLIPESLDVRLVLAGSFSPAELETEFRKLPGWNRVEYVGWVSREGVRDLLKNVRAGVVTFYSVPNSINSQPNKMFEYMSAGLPVIASNFPLWHEFVGDREHGLLVNPLDPADIANAIRELIEHPDEAEEMGKRGLKAVQAKYNWDVEAKKLLALYEALLAKSEKKTEIQQPLAENDS